jgi:hypothetical protein
MDLLSSYCLEDSLGHVAEGLEAGAKAQQGLAM